MFSLQFAGGEEQRRISRRKKKKKILLHMGEEGGNAHTTKEGRKKCQNTIKSKPTQPPFIMLFPSSKVKKIVCVFHLAGIILTAKADVSRSVKQKAGIRWMEGRDVW